MDWSVQQSTWMDVAIIIVLVGGIILGVSQGMLRQLFSLLGLFFGTVIASQKYQDLVGLLGFISDPNWARVIAFVVITVAVLIAANFVGGFFHRVIRFMQLGCIDWLGGGVIGVIEAFLLVEVVLITLAKYPIFGVVKSVEESRIALQLIKLAPAVLTLLPPEFDSVKQLLH